MIWTIIILFLFPLVFPILLTLVFVIPGVFMTARWISILATINFNTGDMKVPTFYSKGSDGSLLVYIVFMSVIGIVFGGIHCVGWFFIFPSSGEATLWRVSSVVLTCTAFLLPLFAYLSTNFLRNRWDPFVVPVFTIILLVYVVSRLLLLVEAFISLRHLTPGMLALVKWTSFIPHI